MSKFWKWVIGIIVSAAGVSLIASVVIIINSLSRRVYTAPIQTAPQRRQEVFDKIVPRSISQQSTASANIDQNPAAEEVKRQPFFFYRKQSVERVSGTFAKLTAGKMMEVNLNGEIKWFLLDKDTKLVCQPGGYLNTSNGTSADDVFIEDKTDKNMGIPWGREITLDNLTARVEPQSEMQIYFHPQPGSLTHIPKVVYVWFENCD